MTSEDDRTAHTVPHAALDEAGFSLIELMAAMTLFALIVVGFVVVRNNAIDQAGRANRTRILRYLTAYQIGELRLGFDSKGNEFDEGEHTGYFEEIGEAFEIYGGYRWEAKIEEYVVAGQGEDDSIPHLFEDSEEDTSSSSSPSEEEEGESISLHRITLTVHPPNDEEPIEVVTFKPIPRGEEEEQPGGGG